MKRKIHFDRELIECSPNLDRINVYVSGIPHVVTEGFSFTTDKEGEIAVEAIFSVDREPEFIDFHVERLNERSRHIGQINLSINDVESGLAGEALSHIHFTPLRVECHHYAMKYEMIGISNAFDELPDHLMAPTYDLKIKTSKSGNVISVEAVKWE